MKYYRYMWIGDSIVDRRRSIQRKLRLHVLPKSVYVLALPIGNTHLLDIYSGDTLKHKYYKQLNQLIIGMAGSKEEAMELGGVILRDVYNATGDFDLRAYLKNTLKNVRLR